MLDKMNDLFDKFLEIDSRLRSTIENLVTPTDNKINNRAEAYLYAGEYDKGLADIESYLNSLRRWKEGDEEAERIRQKLVMFNK